MHTCVLYHMDDMYVCVDDTYVRVSLLPIDPPCLPQDKGLDDAPVTGEAAEEEEKSSRRASIETYSLVYRNTPVVRSIRHNRQGQEKIEVLNRGMLSPALARVNNLVCMCVCVFVCTF